MKKRVNTMFLGLALIGSLLFSATSAVALDCSAFNFAAVTGKLSSYTVLVSAIDVKLAGAGAAYSVTKDANILATLLTAADNPNLTLTIAEGVAGACTLQLNVQ